MNVIPDVVRTKLIMIEPELLISGYAAGYFPMSDEKGEISWYSPDPRAVIPMESVNIPRSTKQLLKKDIFSVRINTQFEEVIRGCANRSETWISEEIIQSYMELYHLGYAFSFEAYDSNSLAGGLYGVALGGAFFGESMFSRKTGASKVALAVLITTLKQRGYALLDVQFLTPHLQMFGAIEISRTKYLEILEKAINKKVLPIL
ncbi:MAG: leucyl/phenylalanyl-tRNA--protein transferase [Candidatus Kryptoniota bacterium]